MNAKEILKSCGFESAAAVRNALSPAPVGSVAEARKRKDVCGGYDLPGHTHGYCPQAVARYRISRDYNG